MNIKDNYYTGREVQKLLGITEPALRNLVNQKKIRKTIPPGRQYGVYLKSEINAFAEKWHAFLLAEEPPKLTFNIATVDDMPSEYELAVRALGATMSVEQRQSWIRKNPSIDYVVKYGSRVVAYCTILPLRSETIIAFMKGEIRGWQITDDDIETFGPNKDTECIIMGTATDPDVDGTTRKHYMLVLIRGLRDELKKLGQQGVKLTRIYATSDTPTGISIALHLGMEEWKPRLGKRIRFVLDVEQSDNFLLESYKEGYEEWKLNKQRVKPEKTSIPEK